MAFEDDVARIVADRQHGSSRLVADMIAACRSLEGDPHAVQRLRAAFGQLRTIDPSMVIVHHFLDTLEPAIDEDFFAVLDAYERQWSGLPERAARGFWDRLGSGPVRLLTHSHSQMVISVLGWLSGWGVSVSVDQTESTPGGEGHAALEELRRLGLKARLIPDDPPDEVLGEVDAVILGMDQYSDQGFVNKVGSARLVGRMRARGKPVYVVGDPRKKVASERFSTSVFETVPWGEGIDLLTG